MVEFLKKAMDWVLEKEADMAKKCYAKPDEIEKQILSLEKKRDEIETKYKENIAEIEHILTKLNSIKEESLKCDT